MKKIFKIEKFWLVIAAVAVVAPVAVFAQTAVQTKAQDNDLLKTANFCFDFNKIADSVISQNIIKAEIEFVNQMTANTENINAGILDTEERLSTRRTAWENNRKNHFQAIETGYSDEKAKVAVRVFYVALTDAIKARSLAYFQTINSFREGVSKILADRDKILLGAVRTYGKEVNAARLKAEEACREEVVQKDLARATLKKELYAARTRFNEARLKAEKFTVQAEELRKTKLAEIENAHNAFVLALNSAKEKFLAQAVKN